MAETDPGKGFISNESPLGRALLGRKVGDEVIVHAPAGDIRYRIMAVT
jgi:transcription elongation factor GreA